MGINVFTIQVSFADKKNLYPNSIVNSNRTEATFALCASFFILLTYARFKHLRKIAFELIVFLSVADIGSNITYLMGSPERHSPECKAQAILQQFFEMSSIIWTVVIGYMLWENVDKERKAFGGAHFRKKLHTFVWGIAMLTALLPATTRSYGQTGAWCWVRGDKTGTIWRFVIFYGPLWGCMTLNGFFYYRVTKKIRMFYSVDSVQQNKLKNLAGSLKYYPLILIVTWTIPTINRVYNSATQNGSFPLTIMSHGTRGLTGILNAIAYGNTPSVRASWQALWRELKVGNWSVICSGSDLSGRPGALSAADEVRSLDDDDDDDDDNSKDKVKFDVVLQGGSKSDQAGFSEPSSFVDGVGSSSLTDVPLTDEDDL